MAEQQKILVVDDERFNVNVLVDLLKPDYKMMVAKNGQQALKAVASANPPDLILLDIMMPEMDGYEVCRRLKADQSTQHIPVIFVTAMGQETDETKGLEVGAVDYITKPISPPIVKARVKTHLMLKSNMEELQKAYKVIETQKERMQTELNVGRDIQLSMVPMVFPERPELDIYATLVPAREVGGDFYDFFFIDEDRFCFCVGDVSDKGVPSALFMAMTKTLIKSRASTDFSTASIVTHVNDEFSEDDESSMFVTLLVGILNLKTGELTTTNAGHNPALLKKADGSLTSLDYLDGPVVGAMPGVAYKQQITTLEQDEMILLYTDGVTEASDSEGKLFSESRLQDLLKNTTSTAAKAVVETITSAVQAYEAGAGQADDITVLALRFKGLAEDKGELGFEMILKNKLEEICRVDERFDEFADRWELSKTVRGTLHMAFDDLLNNIISYAYTDEDEHEIEVKVERAGECLIVAISDDGIPFNPFTSETPDMTLDVEEREIGGLGIHLVRKMLDQVSYQRRVDRNVVTLVKKI